MLTPESYLDAVAWRLDGENYVHPSAAVADADLGENVQIMADAELEDVTVDTSVVFPEATIQGGELRDRSSTRPASRGCTAPVPSSERTPR